MSRGVNDRRSDSWPDDAGGSGCGCGCGAADVDADAGPAPVGPSAAFRFRPAPTAGRCAGAEAPAAWVAAAPTVTAVWAAVFNVRLAAETDAACAAVAASDVYF